MTILDLVRILRSNLKLLAVAMLVGLTLAAAYTLTLPVTYSTASTVQVLGGNSADANSAMLSQQLAASRAGYYAQLAGGPGVTDRIVKESQGALAPGDFSITGSVAEGSSTLTLSAAAPSPSKAQRAADLARGALGQEAKYLETLGSAKTTIFEVFPLTSAPRPAAPSSPRWPVNLLAGALAGLVGGIALVVLRKQLDSRVRHTSEVEKLTGAGVLGVIPKAAALTGKERGGLGHLGPTAESFRMLRTNLRYLSSEQPPRSLVITSAVQGEGKSTVAANLARVLAAAGESVVLVDTDLRRPVVHETFDLDNTVGLTEVLTGQASLPQVIQRGDHENLAVITAGRIPPNPSELLGSRRMSAVIETLSTRYFVILDAPPLLPVTDAGLLSVAADGAAVIYHHGRTHREQIELCTKILDQVGGRYFGSILNMTPPKQMGSTIYGYGAGNYGTGTYGGGYGAGYGESVDADEAGALTPSHEVTDLALENRPTAELPNTPVTPVGAAQPGPSWNDAGTTPWQQPELHPTSEASTRIEDPPALDTAPALEATPTGASPASGTTGLAAPLTRRQRRNRIQ